MNILFPIALFVAALITIAAIADLRKRASRWGLVDHPNDRKHHEKATPLVGGLAMFAGLLAGSVLAQTPQGWGWLLVAAGMLVAVGVIDDRLELGSLIRFIAQIAAVLVIAYAADIRLTDLGAIAADRSTVMLGDWAMPLTVFACVGVISALNMLDGMDGLAASVALIAVVALAVLSGSDHVVTLGLLAAVLLGYLVFNFPWPKPASVFMGDAGSMMIGLVLAWHVISLSQGQQRTIAPVTALWILALPLIDTVSLMVRRILARRSPFAADRAHFHHLLRQHFSAAMTLSICLAISVILAAVGVIAELAGVAEVLMFWGFLGLFAVYTGVSIPWARREYLLRSNAVQ